MLESMGLISKSHGAKLVELEWWKLGKAVVRENGAFTFCFTFFLSMFVCSTFNPHFIKDRTSIYLLRDIGGPIERYEVK